MQAAILMEDTLLPGFLGHGDAFVSAIPWGIRPAFYYADDEIVVVASERPCHSDGNECRMETGE